MRAPFGVVGNQKLYTGERLEDASYWLCLNLLLLLCSCDSGCVTKAGIRACVAQRSTLV